MFLSSVKAYSALCLNSTRDHIKGSMWILDKVNRNVAIFGLGDSYFNYVLIPNLFYICCNIITLAC